MTWSAGASALGSSANGFFSTAPRSSGTTLIGSPDGGFRSSFTLAAPFDAALVDDHRVYHGVTPVEAIDSGRE